MIYKASTYNNYSPFGMPMPNRQVVGGQPYRYAYQGQEKDPETGKEAFELRLWDSRIGRWLTTDPKGQYASPYLGMGNNPMIMIDPDGGKAFGPPGGHPASNFIKDNITNPIRVSFTNFLNLFGKSNRSVKQQNRKVHKESKVATSDGIILGSSGGNSNPMGVELDKAGPGSIWGNVDAFIVGIGMFNKLPYFSKSNTPTANTNLHDLSETINNSNPINLIKEIDTTTYQLDAIDEKTGDTLLTVRYGGEDNPSHNRAFGDYLISISDWWYDVKAYSVEQSQPYQQK